MLAVAVDGANDILSVVHELLEQDHWVTVVASQVGLYFSHLSRCCSHRDFTQSGGASPFSHFAL